MLDSLRRSPKGFLVMLFGMVFGIVWAAGSTPGTPVSAQSTGVTSVAAGSGLSASPSPITTTGSLSVKWGGNGTATTVSRSDHHHDSRYLRLTGGTLSGNLTFSGGSQLVNPRIVNSASAPGSPREGQLWYDTTTRRPYWWDGARWATPPYRKSDRDPAQVYPNVLGQWMPTAAEVSITVPSSATLVAEGNTLGTVRLISGGWGGPYGLEVAVVVNGSAFHPLTGLNPTFGSSGDMITERIAGSTEIPLTAGTHTVAIWVRYGNASYDGKQVWVNDTFLAVTVY